MFGYVVLDKPNLLIKDYTLYKAYYCGLCRAIGKNAGQRFRLTINYDITFLALLAENMEREQPVLRERKCLTHPVGKIPMAEETETFRKIVHANTLLGYWKAADDVSDGGSAAKRAAKAFLKGQYKKARKVLPEFEKTLVTEYARLNRYEKENCADADLVADPFAKILVSLGESFVKEDEKETPNAQNFFTLCYNLGRWIYFIDALDDLDKDFNEKSYNPFLVGVEELTEEKREEIFSAGADALRAAQSVIEDAYNKMEITVSEGPLSNIVYLGLKKRQEEIIEKRGKYGKRPVFGIRSVGTGDPK